MPTPGDPRQTPPRPSRARNRHGTLRGARGHSIPETFAAELLGAHALATVRRRRFWRRGVVITLPEPGALARAAIRAGLRPATDVIGPRSEAAIVAWREVVDPDAPAFLAAFHSGEKTTFIVRGWVSGRRTTLRPVTLDSGFRVGFGFMDQIHQDSDARPGDERLVGVVVSGPQTRRIHPSNFAAADGVLVPVGFNERGSLHLPLLGPMLSIAGESMREMVSSLVTFAAMRLGPDRLQVMVSPGLETCAEVLQGVTVLERGEELTSATRLRWTERARTVGIHESAFTEHTLESDAEHAPMTLLLLTPRDARQLRPLLAGGAKVGIAPVVAGELEDAPRWISLQNGIAHLRVDAGLEDMIAEPAMLSPEENAEAAILLHALASRTTRSDAVEAQQTGSPSLAESPRRELRAAHRAAEGIPSDALDRDLESRGRIFCFGGLRVQRADGNHPGSGWRRKSSELLALLSAHPGGMRREQVCTALWPDSPLKPSLDRLRQCVKQIRDAFGADTLLRDGDMLRLDPSHVWSDIGEFQRAIASTGGSDESLPRLRRAVDLYHGEFLDGVSVDWALPVARRLGDAYLRAADELAEMLVEAGQLDGALQVLDQAIAHFATTEILYCKAMDIEARRGRPPAVRQRFEALGRALATELDVEPSAEAEAVFQRSIRGPVT